MTRDEKILIIGWEMGKQHKIARKVHFFDYGSKALRIPIFQDPTKNEIKGVDIEINDVTSIKGEIIGGFGFDDENQIAVVCVKED
jgi:hypothetical protein